MNNEKNAPDAMMRAHKKLEQIACRLNVLRELLEVKEGVAPAGRDVILSIEALGDDVRSIADFMQGTIQ